MEEDSDAVVLECSESPGLGFDGLDAAVEAFAHGVGDVVSEVGEDVFEVSLKHFGDFDDRLQSATSRPAVPTTEELAGVAHVTIFPEPTKLFFDGPGPRGFQLLVL